jgi:DNA-binding transcriptional MerR regulator
LAIKKAGETKMSVAQMKRSGPLQRVGSEDSTVTGEVLKAATHYLELYVLRNKGCSFSQIAKLLTDCGFNLQPSTVRVYYSEMLATRLDECQRRMNEQILLMSEVRKETQNIDASAIAGKMAAIMDNQRSLAATKIEKLFGVTEPATPAKATAVSAPTSSTPVKATPRNSGPLDDEPSIPILTVHAPARVEDELPSPPPEKQSLAATPPSVQTTLELPTYTCLPLQSGVNPLPQKNNIRAEVYSSGILEHPAIPGLMLNLEQRLYGVALELKENGTGQTRLETLTEKRFRVFWKTPIPMTQTVTGNSFVKMDETLFSKRK